MKLILFLLLFCSVSVFAQVKLPDIATVDSVRVVKRFATRGDTVRSIQFVTIQQGDTIRSAMQDSLAVITAIREKIGEENALASNNTYLLFQQFSKTKGLLEYGKLHQRVARQSYTDWTWSTQKTPYLGVWQLSGQDITAHTLTVSENAKAIRNAGTPKYNGTFQILAQTRIQLSGYLPGNSIIVFDFVQRNQLKNQAGQVVSQDVFMSTDGRFFLVK